MRIIARFRGRASEFIFDFSHAIQLKKVLAYCRLFLLNNTDFQ